jgi:immune inhibitor A
MREPRKFNGAYCFAVAISIAAALLFVAAPALADPAMQGVTKAFTQPDQSRLDLRLWGDEYANGWETQDGYTVILNRTSGYWEYATTDASGYLVLSGDRVGRDAPASAPHLRPSDQALQQSYLKNGGVESPSQPRLNAAPPWASGSTNILVIMVQFPADAGDPNGPQPAVNASFTSAQAQANLFGGTPTGPGNMTQYYNEISFGSLNLVGTVVGPFTVANDKNDYDDGPSNSGALVAEAIALADASVDFTPFDNDGDGQVDMVAIMYAGNGPDNGNYTGADPNTNDLWPHASSIGSVNVDGGARHVSQYFIAPELLNSSPRIRTVGVYCHEFGHKLGLPDLYDTDGSSDGIGHWGLMGSGSWCSNTPGIENGESPSHMSAWSKWFEGWITPTDRTDAHVAQAIPQAETNAFAVRLLDNPGGPNDWPGGSGQYFLIENRQRTGFDRGLDGCGLLTWHIDESLSTNKNEGHTSGSHRLVDLEEADGSPEQLDNGGNRGDSGDPFPGSSNNLLWDDNSTPNARLYNGDASNQSMHLVSTACGATMTVAFNNAPPVADAGTDIIAECTSPTTTAVMLNGTGSSDPDSDALTYTWSATGIVFDNAHSATPTGQFPDGTTIVTLTVSDGSLEDADQVSVTVHDTTPPMISCPTDTTVECTGNCGVLKADPQLTAFFAGVSATDVCDPSPTISNNAPACFPMGPTVVTFTAKDADNNQATCSATVTVEDTTPPEISVVLNREYLWPPNHKMAEVCAAVTVTDICDPHPTFVLYSVESSEPDNGKGDGNTTNDIQNAALGTPDLCVDLRSERMGGGDGRTYTIIYEAMDMSGNTAQDTVCVHVAHDQSGHAMASAGYSTSGKAFATSNGQFAIVIPATPTMDATLIDPSRVLIGNTRGAVEPSQTRRVDVDGDSRKDLVLFYQTSQVDWLSGAAPQTERTSINVNGPDPGDDAIAVVRGDGPVGLHYVTPAGEACLVGDIFAMGSPVSLPIIWVNEPPIAGAPPATPETPATPTSYGTRVSSIHPNPFNPQTTVEFSLSQASRVRIQVYDVRGTLIRSLVDGDLSAGVHSAVWNGADDAGRPATSGIYFVRMIAGTHSEVRKIVMLK